MQEGLCIPVCPWSHILEFVMIHCPVLLQNVLTCMSVKKWHDSLRCAGILLSCAFQESADLVVKLEACMAACDVPMAVC